jgi:hypothetical protein
MSTVILTIVDHPEDPNVVNIKWDVSEEEGNSAARALGMHLVAYLEGLNTANSADEITDVESKE